MKLKNREIILLLSLFLIMMGMAYYYFLWQPITDQITQLRNHNAELENSIRQATIERNQLTGLEREKSAAELELERLHKLVPVEPGIPSLITFIEEQSKETGCRLWGITYPAGAGSSEQKAINLDYTQALNNKQTGSKNGNKAVSNNNNGEVTLEVIARGDYGSLSGLLLKMETYERLLSINPIQIEMLNKPDEPGAINPIDLEQTSPGLLAPLGPAYDNLELSFTVTGYYDNQQQADANSTGIVPSEDLGRDNPFHP